jgi:hypothetical protein
MQAGEAERRARRKLDLARERLAERTAEDTTAVPMAVADSNPVGFDSERPRPSAESPRRRK